MLNSVELIGRVGSDPEYRFMPNGNPVVNLTMATTRRWKDKSSAERVEKTEWHRVVIFGKLAEITRDYVKRGRLIRIAGRIKTRKWQKDGVDHYSTEIIADDMLMLGSRAEAQGKADGVSPEPVANQSPAPSKLDDFDDEPF